MEDLEKKVLDYLYDNAGMRYVAVIKSLKERERERDKS